MLSAQGGGSSIPNRRPTPYHPPLPISLQQQQQAAEATAAAAPPAVEAAAGVVAGGPVKMEIAIKKEGPHLTSPPAIVMTSDTSTVESLYAPGSPRSHASSRKVIQVLQVLEDDERPPSTGMTQRVREEMDETYRHARLKAKALSDPSVAVAAVSESYYQPRVFKVVGGHLAPPTGTMARVHLRRQESEEFGKRIKEEMQASPERHTKPKVPTLKVPIIKVEESAGAALEAPVVQKEKNHALPVKPPTITVGITTPNTPVLKVEEKNRTPVIRPAIKVEGDSDEVISESSFERQARIVKEQMRIFLMRLKEREEKEKREKLEAQQALAKAATGQLEDSAAEANGSSVEEPTLPPADEAAIMLPEPTDLESYLQAFDEGRKLNAISLPALGIGDDGLIQLLDKLPVAAKAPSSFMCLTTLILDANDIERRGATLMASYLKTNGHVLCLSLKWNMIGMDGAEALAEALKTNSALETLQLEGNSIESEGAIALAEALKINSSLTDVNLKENCIGNSGVDALAEALRVNTTLNCLDLTSNGISYAGSNLAESLKGNSGLRYLVLNENVLFDAGASALADALSVNSTLTSLELRDNSIGQEGILDLASAVQTNKIVIDLNVKLNQPGLQGEIKLFELQKARPDVELIWKDAGVESHWDASQCQEIIQHFGADNILNQLVEGEGLAPLVGRDLLLQHLYLDSTEVAHQFFDSIFPESRVVRLNGIEVLIQLLVQRKAPSPESYEMPLNKLPHLLQALNAKLDWITSMLRQAPSPRPERLANGGSKSNEVSLGFLRLKILELLPLLFDLGYMVVDTKLVQANTLATCIDIFFANPLNNFIHQGVVNSLVAALKTQRHLLVNEAIVKCKLLDRLAKSYREEVEKPVHQRAGYLGHLVMLSNEIAAIESPSLQKLLKGNAMWLSFVMKELKEHNELDRQWAIAKPDRPRDCNVGVRSREEALAHA